MAEKPDPDKLTGPGGMTMRQLHDLVKQSARRDAAAARPQNKRAQKTSRWQRVARYVWDKKKG